MIEELEVLGCTYSSSYGYGYGYGPNLSYQIVYHILGGARIHVMDHLGSQFIFGGLGTGQWGN